MKFEIQVPYSQVQTVNSFGAVVASIEADSVEDALEILKGHLAEGNDMFTSEDGTVKIDSTENDCEIESAEGAEYDWSECSIDAEEEVEA